MTKALRCSLAMVFHFGLYPARIFLAEDMILLLCLERK